MHSTMNMQLTPDKWEQFVRAKQMVPIRKINSNNGTIYIAEGKRLPDLSSDNPVERRPHYKMCSLFYRGGADFFSIDLVDASKHPNQKERCAIALGKIDEMVAANQEVGRYK